jgi:dTDP-4-amino-4,6-dideoxygalactose transaminase
MKFNDLQSEYLYFKVNIDAALERVRCSGTYLFGPELEKFEGAFAQHVGVKYAIGVKNCTDAITLLVRHLLKERPNAPIILPNFGAYPTAVACRICTPNLYFVDVDDTLTMNVDKLPNSLRDGIVFMVHLFGNIGDKRVRDYASTNNHILIEDCAQATGAGCGALGDYSVFSFYPTKPLAAMGDGGMICSSFNDLSVFKKLRFYGYDTDEVGINSRMDEFQASILMAKLQGFDSLNMTRRGIAQRYMQHVQGVRVLDYCIYHQFVVQFNDRNRILAELDKRDIPHAIHYPQHVSEMDTLKGLHNQVTYRVNDKVVSLPVHPFMSDTEISKVEDFLHDYRYNERTD